MINIAVGKPLPNTTVLRSTDCSESMTPPTRMAEQRQCGQPGRDYMLVAWPTRSRQGRRAAEPSDQSRWVHGERCVVRCGQVMATVREVSAFTQGSYRKLCVIFQTFPGKKLRIFKTFQGDFYLHIYMKYVKKYLSW